MWMPWCRCGGWWLGVSSYGLGNKLEHCQKQRFFVEGHRSPLSCLLCRRWSQAASPSNSTIVNHSLNTTQHMPPVGSVHLMGKVLSASLGLLLMPFWLWVSLFKGQLHDSGQHRDTTGVTSRLWLCSSEHNCQTHL